MAKDPTPRLTHVDSSGKAHMVDVSEKDVTERIAHARGIVRMSPHTLEMIRGNSAAKGDVLGTARIAGIMAAKRTSELIPLCHGLALTHVDLKFWLNDAPHRVNIEASARTHGKTGVEMEALSAVAVAALTIYDMCKAVDRDMVIDRLMVTSKSGGRSGTYSRSEPTPTHTP
jgi:cyclic pyranopterin monophosphate synthase